MKNRMNPLSNVSKSESTSGTPLNHLTQSLSQEQSAGKTLLVENQGQDLVGDSLLGTPDLLCPSCLSERDAADQECAYCGIVFSQYHRWLKATKSKITISGLYHLSADDLERLEKMWSKVQTLYWSEDEHYKFMMHCLRLKSLPFAIHCYKKRLEIFPDDDIADLQIAKLKSLAKEWYDADRPIPSIPFNRGLFRLSQALSVMGMVGAVVVLFLGLLTNTPLFYGVVSVFMAMAFIGLYALSRHFRNDIGDGEL